MARDNMVVAQAASFGAEGLERGEMFQTWAFRCMCGKGMHMAKGLAIGHAERLARDQGWRYTSKRGWECPAHEQRVAKRNASAVASSRLHRRAK